VAILGVVVAVLPASIVARFLPPGVHAEDFSGSLWHGSAGRFSVEGRDAGAIEWRLHPASLVGFTLSADIHWVKVGFVVDGMVGASRMGFSAHDVSGGGPIEDLRDFGVDAGWRGTVRLQAISLAGNFERLRTAMGDIRIGTVTAEQFADGADLGSYDVHLGGDAVDADGNVTAQITDAGGPLEMRSTLRISAKERTALLTGTVLPRADAPPGLARQIDDLSRLRGRDSGGRIPFDFEFSY